MRANLGNAVKIMVSFAIGALVALVLATAADAQDQRCRFKLNGGFIRWGLQDPTRMVRGSGWIAVPRARTCGGLFDALFRANRRTPTSRHSRNQ